MRIMLAYTGLWAVLSGGTSGRELRAQNVIPADTASLPVESPIERLGAVFNAPDPSEHAGLLGKIYLQTRDRQQDIDHWRVGETWKGFDTHLNLPAMTIDTPLPLDIDVCAGYVNVTSSQNR